MCSVAGLRTRVEYDAANRAVLAVADTEYDAFGRPTRVTGPPVPDWRRGGALARPATATEYDGCGRPTRVVDAMGVATANAYDGLGRLIRSEVGGVATEREYDAEGNVLSLSHGRPGQGDGRTTWEYDALNRKIREVRPLGRATEWARDAAGRVARERRPSGRTVVNAHSPSGLLLSARFWAPGATAPAEEREFRHDACGRVVWARDGEGESAYVYDACGRPTRETRVDAGLEQWWEGAAPSAPWSAFAWRARRRALPPMRSVNGRGGALGRSRLAGQPRPPFPFVALLRVSAPPREQNGLQHFAREQAPNRAACQRINVLLGNPYGVWFLITAYPR